MVALGEEIKIVYIDGALSNGTTRSIRGKLISETDLTITIQRKDGELTIGKSFLIKVERWNSGRRNFEY